MLSFLPTSRKELERLGWDYVDVIIFSGDAYVDHPAFGNALIGRLLESLGLRVAIVPQPNWRDDLRDFSKLGKPRLFFAISAGNMDSMVNHYTPQKRLRSDDAYTAGGKAGFRPDYATVVYTKIVKKLFPDVPVVIGGIEASLRRLTHYDYWQDALKPSVLYESGADVLVYGMAEKPLKAIVDFYQNGTGRQLNEIPQIAYIEALNNLDAKAFTELPSHESCVASKKTFARSFVMAEKEFNSVEAACIMQRVANIAIVINPPYPTLSTQELDSIYRLPFLRRPHFRYKEPVPAFDMIKNSITIHRGCFGGCSFCTLAAHQGKFISSRSEKSVLDEVKQLVESDGFNGHITDLGGPSANMYMMQPFIPEKCRVCKRPSCIFPAVCSNLNNNHKPITNLYRKAADIKGVKLVTIGSGIRYDLFTASSDAETREKGFDDYFKQLLAHHVSGRLKVAPEHFSDNVLKIMRKPPLSNFLTFKKRFTLYNKQLNLKLQLIPYLISGHPGTSLADMAETAAIARKEDLITEQVQDFTPTPMTLSSVIFYTGMNPHSGETVFVTRNLKDKELQKQFFFYRKKEYRDTIINVLRRIGRNDLVIKLYGKL